MKLSRGQQALEMIEALSLYAKDIEVAVCRNIGRQKETVLAKKWDPKLMGWLAHENANNLANIWVRPNPAQLHPWLFLDDLTLAVANKLAKKYQCIVVETSIGNCQVRLLANTNLNSEQRKMVQQNLVKILTEKDISADFGSTAGCKWGRLPGFRNRKPNRDAWTNLISIPDQNLPKFDPAPHIKQISTTVVVARASFSVNKAKQNNEEDQSGRDFGYIVNRLKFYKEHGLDYLTESKNLESDLRQRTHKRNPQQYAALTINSALKRL